MLDHSQIICRCCPTDIYDKARMFFRYLRPSDRKTLKPCVMDQFPRKMANEQSDVRVLMGEKAEVTYFAKEAKDPFVYTGDTIYGEILSLEENKNTAGKEKRKLFGRRRKS